MYLNTQLPIRSIYCWCLSLSNEPIFLTCGVLLSRDVNKFCPVENITLRLQFTALLLLLLSRFSCVWLYGNPQTGLCTPPGSAIPGILQARTLERAAISFSNVWKWKVKMKSLSRVQLLATPWTAVHQAPPSMRFSRQEYWSGVPLPSPFQGASIF